MATKKERRVADPNEFFDVIGKLKGSIFVTIGYVSAAKINAPVVKRKNPDTGRLNSYPDYLAMGKMFGYEGEIGGIIKLTSYNIKWQSPEEYSKRYKKYFDDKNAVKAKYGLPLSVRKDGYQDKMDFGNGGIKVYGGENDEKKGHSYTNLNTFSSRPRSAYYMVDMEGNIIREITKEELIPYFKNTDSTEGLAALRKMGADDATIKQYTEELAALKFIPRTFLHGAISHIVATVNGEPIIYINNNLTTKVRDEITIKPQQFLAVATEKYKEDMQKVEPSIVEEGVSFHLSELNEDVAKMTSLMRRMMLL